ncbi:hypothetical protein MPLB_780034 [Mesorhizobium sp. ORS 3324]|nr:hypothetical protein MPLB_780034 [Mesorhizobium sp. ORS 3324]
MPDVYVVQYVPFFQIYDVIFEQQDFSNRSKGRFSDIIAVVRSRRLSHVEGEEAALAGAAFSTMGTGWQDLEGHAQTCLEPLTGDSRK